MRLWQHLATASKVRKMSKLQGTCLLRMLNLEQVLHTSSVSSEERIEFLWLRAAVSSQRGEWSNRNPYSALSLSSPHRWSTVIRFLCSTSSSKVYILHSGCVRYACKQGWMNIHADTLTDTRYPAAFVHLQNVFFILYTERKNKNKSATEKFIGIPNIAGSCRVLHTVTN